MYTDNFVGLQIPIGDDNFEIDHQIYEYSYMQIYSIISEKQTNKNMENKRNQIKEDLKNSLSEIKDNVAKKYISLSPEQKTKKVEEIMSKMEEDEYDKLNKNKLKYLGKYCLLLFDLGYVKERLFDQVVLKKNDSMDEIFENYLKMLTKKENLKVIFNEDEEENADIDYLIKCHHSGFNLEVGGIEYIYFIVDYFNYSLNDFITELREEFLINECDLINNYLGPTLGLSNDDKKKSRLIKMIEKMHECGKHCFGLIDPDVIFMLIEDAEKLHSPTVFGGDQTYYPRLKFLPPAIGGLLAIIKIRDPNLEIPNYVHQKIGDYFLNSYCSDFPLKDKRNRILDGSFITLENMQNYDFWSLGTLIFKVVFGEDFFQFDKLENFVEEKNIKFTEDRLVKFNLDLKEKEIIGSCLANLMKNLELQKKK